MPTSKRRRRPIARRNASRTVSARADRIDREHESWRRFYEAGQPHPSVAIGDSLQINRDGRWEEYAAIRSARDVVRARWILVVGLNGVPANAFRVSAGHPPSGLAPRVRSSQLTEESPELRRLQVALERSRWETTAIEIDRANRKARLDFKSFDGRLVTFSVDSLGRAFTERSLARISTSTVGRRGDRMPVQRMGVEFIGRERHASLVEGLEYLSHYLAQNGTRELPPSVIAAALADGIASCSG